MASLVHYVSNKRLGQPSHLLPIVLFAFTLPLQASSLTITDKPQTFHGMDYSRTFLGKPRVSEPQATCAWRPAHPSMFGTIPTPEEKLALGAGGPSVYLLLMMLPQRSSMSNPTSRLTRSPGNWDSV